MNQLLHHNAVKMATRYKNYASNNTQPDSGMCLFGLENPPLQDTVGPYEAGVGCGAWKQGHALVWSQPFLSDAVSR